MGEHYGASACSGLWSCGLVCLATPDPLLPLYSTSANISVPYRAGTSVISWATISLLRCAMNPTPCPARGRNGIACPRALNRLLKDLHYITLALVTVARRPWLVIGGSWHDRKDLCMPYSSILVVLSLLSALSSIIFPTSSIFLLGTNYIFYLTILLLTFTSNAHHHHHHTEVLISS